MNSTRLFHYGPEYYKTLKPLDGTFLFWMVAHEDDDLCFTEGLVALAVYEVPR